MASKSDGDLAKPTSGFGVETERGPGAEASSAKKVRPQAASKLATKAKKTPKQKKSRKQRVDPSAGIPKAVTRRMYQRVGIFSGIPTLLAFATIPGSYFVTEQGWIDFPSTVVLFVSITFLGLGLLGVSYGIVSASWDEEIPGSILGTSEFQLNLGRIQERRRQQKKLRKQAQEKQEQAATKESDQKADKKLDKKTNIKANQPQKSTAEVHAKPADPTPSPDAGLDPEDI